MKKRQGKSAAAIASRPSIGNNVSAANNEALFDRKIDLITEGIAPYFALSLQVIQHITTTLKKAFSVFIIRVYSFIPRHKLISIFLSWLVGVPIRTDKKPPLPAPQPILRSEI